MSIQKWAKYPKNYQPAKTAADIIKNSYHRDHKVHRDFLLKEAKDILNEISAIIIGK